ncbi:hypothetical protein F383_25844 [Gossypium arboreum]|uniref:Uncharacterized protein n=1 Tax=Gossypium arboreum TaxID=29729 RepID=A0A0B0P0L4_GOSAR|nr:hypothetical protein F383_25844 [Gossypium arboreum]
MFIYSPRAYAKLVDMIDVFYYACTMHTIWVRKGNEMVFLFDEI